MSARDVPPAPVDVQNPLCAGVSPTTDFSDPYVITDFNMGNDQTFSAFGSGAVSGGTYPAVGTGYPFTDVSGHNWHITGTVGPRDDAHFGIYWLCTLPNASGGCMLDVSRFKGISFKVKGYAGPDHQMTLSLGRAQNDTNSQNAMCGNCVLPAGSDASAGNYCRGPRAIFTVPADGSETTVTLLWTDFHGGSPYRFDRSAPGHRHSLDLPPAGRSRRRRRQRWWHRCSGRRADVDQRRQRQRRRPVQR